MSTITAASHRTQIYLPQDLYTQAMATAKKQSISLAELIRQALETQLANVSKMQGKRDLLALKGSIHGPKDLATNLDHYLAEMYRSKT